MNSEYDHHVFAHYQNRDELEAKLEKENQVPEDDLYRFG